MLSLVTFTVTLHLAFNLVELSQPKRMKQMTIEESLGVGKYMLHHTCHLFQMLHCCL